MADIFRDQVEACRKHGHVPRSTTSLNRTRWRCERCAAKLNAQGQSIDALPDGPKRLKHSTFMGRDPLTGRSKVKQ